MLQIGVGMGLKWEICLACFAWRFVLNYYFSLYLCLWSYWLFVVFMYFFVRIPLASAYLKYQSPTDAQYTSRKMIRANKFECLPIIYADTEHNQSVFGNNILNDSPVFLSLYYMNTQECKFLWIMQKIHMLKGSIS